MSNVCNTAPGHQIKKYIEKLIICYRHLLLLSLKCTAIFIKKAYEKYGDLFFHISILSITPDVIVLKEIILDTYQFEDCLFEWRHFLLVLSVAWKIHILQEFLVFPLALNAS